MLFDVGVKAGLLQDGAGAVTRLQPALVDRATPCRGLISGSRERIRSWSPAGLSVLGGERLRGLARHSRASVMRTSDGNRETSKRKAGACLCETSNHGGKGGAKKPEQRDSLCSHPVSASVHSRIYHWNQNSFQPRKGQRVYPDDSLRFYRQRRAPDHHQHIA